MKVSTRTEYGIRLLIQLARHDGDGPVSLAGIARREKLPHAYLEQLVGQLRRAGLVSATRGQAGGYQLARPAGQINMADAVRILEGPLLEMPCAGADNLEACSTNLCRSDNDRLMTDELVIADLEVSIGGKKILKGVDLTVRQGEVHALMGPNGSGKTSLAYTLMGHPDYRVDAGSITWRGQDLLAGPTPIGMSPDKRARLGLFLAFQYPSAIPGVTVASFLRNIYNAVHHPKQAGAEGEDAIKYTGSPLAKFRRMMEEKMALLRMDSSFASRYVNEGFSGGEKKRLEMLQMAVLSPTLAILDETDSGLDIDALRTVAEGINATLSPEMGVLMITHYQRMLNYVKPDQVHVLMDGRVVMSGGEELSHQLEANGYDWVREQVGLPVGVLDDAGAPEPVAEHA